MFVAVRYFSSSERLAQHSRISERAAKHSARTCRDHALDCADGIYELQIFEHLPGERNEWADALSLIWQPSQVSCVPAELLRATQCHVEPRSAAWWKLHSTRGRRHRIERANPLRHLGFERSVPTDVKVTGGRLHTEQAGRGAEVRV